ncbi:glycosyltransferase family 2 protein [Roseicyclus sp.]|uniref:glycosyltransferase family 2 protein n=1 Tax=Roseicyclus sp. TaxID=1914329 RepID=UPI003FA11A50
MAEGGFSVVTVAREPLPVLRRFVEWHLGCGAERIVLFLDDPDDPARMALSGEPRLELRSCTAELWRGLGVKPDARFTRRQRAALNAAYAEAAAPWLLVLDADERMWLRGRSIPDTLAALPADALSLRVRSAEAVTLREGGSALRLPIPRRVVNEVYGPDADLFRRREGLVGHPEGKSFHRTGLAGLRIRLHWAEDAQGARLPGPVLGPEDRAHLVHDIAPDYARWRAKVAWRAGSHGFSGPLKDRIDAIAALPDPEAGYRALHDRLHILGPEEAAALEAAGGLLRETAATPMT